MRRRVRIYPYIRIRTFTHTLLNGAMRVLRILHTSTGRSVLKSKEPEQFAFVVTYVQLLPAVNVSSVLVRNGHTKAAFSPCWAAQEQQTVDLADLTKFRASYSSQPVYTHIYICVYIYADIWNLHIRTYICTYIYICA